MLKILTLTWNAEEKLSKLRDSLTPSLAGIDYQWFIKDNKSTDNTVAMASKWGDKVTVIQYKNNAQNFAAGCNYLFDLANAEDDDLIMLLNNDITFGDTHSISNMINIIENDPDVGVVGARLLYTGTNKLQHAGVVFDTICKLPAHHRVRTESDEDSMKNKEFQAVTGAVLITKAKYYKNIWTNNQSKRLGMDENYHWAFDDVDLCLSIKHNMNKKIVYCGNTNIFHEESLSLKKNPANKLFLAHNINYLRSKWCKKCVIDGDIYIKDPNYNLYKKA